jgi:DNA-binding CsgD family transcriptional regulator
MTFALEAERLARRAGTGGPLLPSQGMLVLYRLLRGEPGEFPVEHRPPDTNAAQYRHRATAFLSTIHAFWLLATGERAEALRFYRSMPPPAVMLPMVRLPALAWMIDLAAEFDDRQRAAQCYDLLRPHAELLVCGGAGIVCVLGTVHEALGRAAATIGRLDDASRHLRAAIALAERIGMPPAVAGATYHLAQVLARRKRPGDQDEASALATSASALAGKLGMRPLEALARALTATVGGRGGPLTRREAEIATLVARGLTNRQIAAVAHIGERTVETHVQHILDKLGLGSRTQVAAWVDAQPG